MNSTEEMVAIMQAQLNETQYQSALTQHKTNHVLHLLLSILMIGLWVIPWVITSASNCDERNAIHKKYNKPTETNYGSTLIILFIVLVVVAIGIFGNMHS